MRKILLAFLFTWNAQQLYAQASQSGTGQYVASEYYSNHLPKSSESASLGSFGNLPVNYFTGQPEVSLPLVTLTSRDLSVPISISYDASGVKTDELAGQVGLKWSLNAGGYIARDLNGLPDEHPTLGYWKSALDTDYWNNNFNISDWVTHSEKNSRDTSPDEFIMNVNGRSVRFVFDKFKRPVPIPRQNIKIAYAMVSNKINKFEVTFEDGTKYIFGGHVSAVEERKIETLSMKLRFRWTWTTEWYGSTIAYKSYYTGREVFDHETENSDIKTIDFFNSKWYLKEIISANGDIITFTYTKGTDIKYVTKPFLVRFKPVLVELGSYQTELRTCTEPIYILGIYFGCNNWTTYRWTHPAAVSDAWGPHPATMVTDSYNLLAIRKFTEQQAAPGSALPSLQLDPPFYRLPQSETAHYFKPEEYSANPGGVIANHTLVTESNIRLSTIQTATQNRVTFVTSSRTDLPNAIKYDRIYLQDMNNNYVKTIKLNYTTVEPDHNDVQNNDYFWISEATTVRSISSLTHASPTFYPHFVRGYNESVVSNATLRKFVFEGLKEYNYKRLYLESIIDETGGLNMPLYEFEYDNRHLLKRRTTPLADGLGFSRTASTIEPDFNLHSGKKARIINSYYPSMITGTRVVTRGMLTKIKYPTKGSTVFSYSILYGPRVEYIRDFDEAMNPLNQRQIQYVSHIHQAEGLVFTTYNDYKMPNTNEWMKHEISSSAPQNSSPYKSPLTIYPHVRVYQGLVSNHNGYEEFKYTSSSDIVTPIHSTPPENHINHPIDSYYVFPYPKKEQRGHLRGMLREHSVFDKNNRVLKKVENFYLTNPNNYSPVVIYGLTGGSFAYTSTTNTNFWTGKESNPQYRRRYGRYKLSADWVVLDKTTETIYDIENPSTGSFTTVSEYKYDPLNLQMIETARYNQLEPNVKTISKTKYVTHADYSFTATNEANCYDQYTQCMNQCYTEPDGQVRGYCESDCSNQYSNCADNPGANAAPETDAIITLKNKHQINTPVEVQGLIQDNGAEKLISAVVYNYTKEGSPTIFVKPKTIIGMKQAIDPASYQSSRVDQSGVMQTDHRLRRLHTFNTYQQTTGNLLQQTSLDGISTAYTWGHNNSLVTDFTVNPGSSISQTFSYNHKLLVGLNYVTDQNNLKYYYDYDRLNRLKLEKDNDGNITARYRYHYKTSRGYNMTISGPNNGVTGQSVNYSSYEDLEYGQTTHEWNMGDGNIKTSSYVTHIYQLPGNYTVTLKKTNPEYGTVTLTKVISIGNPPILSILVGGSTSVDLCNVWNGTTSLMATIRNGCLPYSFSWEYRLNGGSWIMYAAGSPVQPPPGFGYQEGYWEVRCIAYSSECSDQVASGSIWLSSYKSDPNCFGPIMH